MDLQRESKSITRASKYIFGLDQYQFLLGVKIDPNGTRRVNNNSKASQKITVCVTKCIFDAIHKNKNESF